MALPEVERREKPLIQERLLTPEIPPEIEHVEAVAGAEFTLPQPITVGNQVILDNAAPQKITITLPLTEEEMMRALHFKIVYSLRWLAEWAKRLLKIVGGRFIYRYE